MIQRTVSTLSIVLFLSLLIIPTTFLQAQKSSNGNITGKLIDGLSGEALRSGTVQLLGTKKGAYSDVKGEFRLKDVAAGTYSVKVSYIGYNPKEITGIVVKAGETVNLGNIVLESSVKMTQEVVVEAERTKDNQAAILALRKNAAQVSDGISAEEIKRLPDSDAGQSLKRVSGVTVVNDKFVYVRGVSERYSNTTLNGAALATTEPDKKAFAFDMFPSEFLQDVNIAKSFTPDLPGNFAGGLVQLNTVDFPDGFAFKVSVSSNINSNYSGKENKFLTSPGGDNDWLASDDGTRALPNSVPATRRDFNDLQRRANDPFDTTGAAQTYESMSKSFSSNLLKRENSTVDYLGNRGIGLSLANKFEIGESSAFGLIASFNYDNSHSYNDLSRNGYLASFDTLYTLEGLQTNAFTGWGGLFNLAFKSGSHSLNFKNVYNRSAETDMVNLEGKDIGYQFFELKNFSTQYVEKTLYTGTLGGEHFFGLGDNNLLVNWRGGYSNSERDEPDFRRMKFARSLADVEFDPNTKFSPDFVQTQQGDGSRLGRFYSNLTDEAITGGLDLTFDLAMLKTTDANASFKIESPKIKIGTLYETRKREFSARSMTILKPDVLDEDIDTILYDWQNPERIFDEDNFRYTGGFLMGEDSKLSDSYDAEEELMAFYFMLDIPFSFSGIDLRFIGGVRYEDNLQKLNSHLINDQPVEVNQKNQDLLPSINLIWKIDNQSNLRASASQTLTRPSLREFAPFSFFDFLQQALVQGNPNLVRALIQNYDLRYEYFPNPGEVLSASIFYKSFDNAIEETIFPQQSELTRTFDNSDGKANNYGIEFEIRKNLGFISSALTNLFANINLALINSQITVKQGGEGTEDTRSMWGQSPYSLNVGLYYVIPDWKTAINLGYNKYGKRIIQVAQQGIYQAEDPHVYELPRDMVDMSIIQPIGEQFEIKLAIKDLLNQSLVWEQSGRKVATNLKGTSISLGLSATIR